MEHPSMHDQHHWPVTAIIGLLAGAISVASPLPLVAFPPMLSSLLQTIALSVVGGTVTFFVQRWWRKKLPERTELRLKDQPHDEK